MCGVASSLSNLSRSIIFSNPEEPVEMRPVPHQAASAFSAQLADVLGCVLQGVEPPVPQVRLPGLEVKNLFNH